MIKNKIKEIKNALVEEFENNLKKLKVSEVNNENIAEILQVLNPTNMLSTIKTYKIFDKNFHVSNLNTAKNFLTEKSEVLIKVSEEVKDKLGSKIYDFAINGIISDKSCATLAQELLEKYDDKEQSVQELISSQTKRYSNVECAMKLFKIIGPLLITQTANIVSLSSITAPVVAPIVIIAIICMLFYIQMRITATIAIIYGYDAYDSNTQKLICNSLVDCSIIIEKIKSININGLTKIVSTILKKVVPDGSFINMINSIIKSKGKFKLIPKLNPKGIFTNLKSYITMGALIGIIISFTIKLASEKACDLFSSENNCDILQ